VWNMYGPTETTVWSTCWRVEHPGRGISIGTPIANTSVWIIDEQGQPCPIGVPGEIWIGGEGVALGYLHRDDLTAERFPRDPFSHAPDARIYRTGDRGRWLANGTLEHLGRLDFQVKLRGFRIEPGEIEAVARLEPSVIDCVVVVREIAANDERLVLYAVCNDDEDAVWPKLRAQLAGRLPAYMQPQHFVRLAALPRTPNGKTDRKALPAPSLNALANTEDAEPGVSASEDTRERYLGAVWCELVGADDVRSSDNFFDIGGHSLLAIEMVTRVKRETGIKLNLLDVATSPLASLAAALPEGDLTEPGRTASLGGRLRQLFGRR